MKLSEEWKLTTLGKSCEFYNGKAHEQEINANGNFIVINSKFISSDGSVIKKTDSLLFPLQINDIAMVMSDLPNGKALAKCYLVNENNKYSLNQRICAIRSQTFDPKFLYYQLNRNQYFLRFDNGNSQTNLRKNDILKCPLYLPPIASQRRIADILDKADEIIRKRKEAIALTEQLQKSIFLDMFGDPVINPKGWEVVELGKLIIGKPNNGIFRKNDEYGGKIPVIWVKELFRDSILNTKNSISLDPTEQEIKKFGLKKGDILFCRSSLKLEGVGYNNVFDDEDDSALFECHLIRVSPNQSKINSIFLNYLLRTEGMRKVIISKSNTVTMSTIGQEQIKTIPVILPPKNIQDNFDKQLRYLIKLIAKKQFFLQESENLFNSLLQKAFKGEL